VYFSPNGVWGRWTSALISKWPQDTLVSSAGARGWFSSWSFVVSPRRSESRSLSWSSSSSSTWWYGFKLFKLAVRRRLPGIFKRTIFGDGNFVTRYVPSNFAAN